MPSSSTPRPAVTASRICACGAAGCPTLDYQTGRNQRAFEPQTDVLVVHSWKVLCALDRHVIDMFPFPEPFPETEHIALDARALTYQHHWLLFYHIIRRFPNLRDLSVMSRGCRELAKAPLSSQLTLMDDHDMERGPPAKLVCERVEAELKSPRLIDPDIVEWSQLRCPAAQLVDMILVSDPGSTSLLFIRK